MASPSCSNSSTGRPLPMRARADLDISRQVYQGRGYYVIKDPLSMEYYRFQEEEYFLLQAVDGKTSLDELKRLFEEQFPPQRIDSRELARLVAMLHRSGLIVSDAPGQGEALEKRLAEKRRKKRIASWTNPLGLRFKGVNPDRFLDWLVQRVGFVFSRGFGLFVLLLALSALMLVVVQFDVFRARLPWFQEFFAAKNWLGIAAVLAITKVLHEFGHGLACKKLGGECHEMGVMFLVLTPCLYCNVSDSWMLPNKWHRIAIGAAGMYVELLLASIATFVWWFSQPGILHYMALDVMFVCSVSTIIFNANPLLRFDGYYILSDFMEIPNLRQKASSILQREMGAWFLGLQSQEDPFLPKRHQIFFALYTIAAALYRWVISAGILWFLYHVFEPYGLQVIGQMIALMALYGLVVQPIWRLIQYFYVPGRLDQVNVTRMICSASVASLLLFAFLFVPLPYYVYGTLHVEPRGASTVYVDVPGQLTTISSVTKAVEEDQPLLTLTNVDLDIAIEQLTQKRDQIASRVDMLRQLALTNDSAASEISAAEESLITLQQQLDRRKEDRKRLQINAPIAGHLFPPPRVKPNEQEGRLGAWSGTPLQDQNIGAFLTSGTPVAQVGDPSQLMAIIVIDQSAIEFIKQDQQVEIQLIQQPGMTYPSRIAKISSERRQTAAEKSGSRQAAATSPQAASFQASAPFVIPESEIAIGGRGTAKIYAGQRTLASRLWWAVRRTFRIEG